MMGRLRGRFLRFAAQLFMSWLVMLFASSGHSFSGERIALVIGIGGYKHTSPLINPPNDAELMAQTLEQAGFSVTRLIDPDQRGMKRAMLDFGRSLREEDIDAGLFFYAGHGVQVKGENYLIPVSARIEAEDEIELEGINVNDFLAVMNSSNSKINIVILDACRNNPFARSFRSATRGLASVDAPKGTLIAYATAPGDVALDGDGNNSPYTQALAGAISNLGGKPIETVFKEARKEVLRVTDDRQLPWETSSVTGDFYFFPGQTGQQNRPSTAAPAKSELIADAYGAARQLGTESAWQAFIDQFGNDAENFHVKLALQQLASLRQPEEKALRSPVSGSWTCTENSNQLAGGRLCVSSILDPQFGNKYGGKNLLDGKSSTAWVEGKNGDGLGESVTIEFPRGQRVSSISIRNGYNKNDGIYRKNGRVRNLLVETSSGYKGVADLEDHGDWQSINISDNTPVEWIQLSIDSVYRGSKYRDTAISELRVK